MDAGLLEDVGDAVDVGLHDSHGVLDERLRMRRAGGMDDEIHIHIWERLRHIVPQVFDGASRFESGESPLGFRLVAVGDDQFQSQPEGVIEVAQLFHEGGGDKSGAS